MNIKVPLEELRLGINGISEEAHVGIPETAGTWKHKKNVHNDFLKAVIDCWKNKKQVITAPDGKKYEISIRSL